MSTAVNGVEILQESSISITRQESSDEEIHNKNGKIALFIARLNTAPVAISASGVFDVNVNLVTIVISIAMTYFAIVFSFTPDKSKHEEETAMALRNLSSLLNNISATLNLSKD